MRALHLVLLFSLLSLSRGRAQSPDTVARGQGLIQEMYSDLSAFQRPITVGRAWITQESGWGSEATLDSLLADFDEVITGFEEMDSLDLATHALAWKYYLLTHYLEKDSLRDQAYGLVKARLEPFAENPSATYLQAQYVFSHANFIMRHYYEAKTGFEYCINMLPSHHQMRYDALAYLCNVYMDLDLPDQGLSHNWASLQYGLAQGDSAWVQARYNQRANLYISLGELDSATYYFEQYRALATLRGDLRAQSFSYANLALYYLNRGIEDSLTIAYLKQAISVYPDFLHYAHLVNLYLDLDNLAEAAPLIVDLEKHEDKGLGLPVFYKYRALYRYYDAVKDTAKAYTYQTLLIEAWSRVGAQAERDEFMKRRYKERMEEEDTRVRDLEEKQRAFLKNTLLVAGGILVLLILLGFYLRQRQRARQSELQLARVSAELKAIRAQINPHFIFNALASIQRFVLTHNPKEANDYLTKFSRFIRTILYQSERATLPLSEELATLQQYLEIEQTRLPFQLLMQGHEDIDLNRIPFPSMLLHTFAENALWHGLAPRGEAGILTIALRQQGNTLELILEDNGIGREAARAMRAVDHQSKGLGLAQDKVRLYNQSQAHQLSISTEDLYHSDGTAAGTRVVFRLQLDPASLLSA